MTDYTTLKPSEFNGVVGMDGWKWAEAFEQHFPNSGVDFGTMLAWFCNAIMAGYDEGRRVPQMTNFDKVAKFHEKFNLPIGRYPSTANLDVARVLLRDGFYIEEFTELMEAQGFDPQAVEIMQLAWEDARSIGITGESDIIEIADALGDLEYFNHGTAIEYGILLNPVFDEIHDSNMSKLGEDGKPIYREDGKVLKGPNYFKPNIAKVLRDQAPFN